VSDFNIVLKILQLAMYRRNRHAAQTVDSLQVTEQRTRRVRGA